MSVFVIAEIGINHNGSLDTAEKLIQVAKTAGCDAVKFQKRTVETVYSAEELAKPRETPFGTTVGDYKRAVEFGKREYDAIDEICRCLDIPWSASCWDLEALDFISRYNPPFYKVASASLTDDTLLRATKAHGKPVILSTGMSTLRQVDHAVDVLGREGLTLLHCNATYPASYDELNLLAIPALRDRYGLPVGYSGHETGLATTIAAVALGACVVERHITLDRAMWGSDQAASVEPQGLAHLVRDIRIVERAMGDGVKVLYDSEVPIMRKLRRVDCNAR